MTKKRRGGRGGYSRPQEGAKTRVRRREERRAEKVAACVKRIIWASGRDAVEKRLIMTPL